MSEEQRERYDKITDLKKKRDTLMKSHKKLSHNICKYAALLSQDIIPGRGACADGSERVVTEQEESLRKNFFVRVVNTMGNLIEYVFYLMVSYVHAFVRSLARLFVCSFARSFDPRPSIVRSIKCLKMQ